MAAITPVDGSRSEPRSSEDSLVASSVLASNHIESERKVHHEQEDHRRARRSVRPRRNSSRLAAQGRKSGTRRLGRRTPPRTPPLGSAAASAATKADAAASTTSAAALEVNTKAPISESADRGLRTSWGAKNRAAIPASVLCHKSATTIKRVFEEK